MTGRNPRRLVLALTAWSVLLLFISAGTAALAGVAGQLVLSTTYTPYSVPDAKALPDGFGVLLDGTTTASFSGFGMLRERRHAQGRQT